MNDEHMFDRLVNNAFDFFNEALDQFREKPKYSVINFYSGIELLIKARLMAEHWTLIVSKRSTPVPDREKFERGDFQSVTFSEASELLAKTLRIPLNLREIDVFRNLSNHRNRLVHFYHDDIPTTQRRILEQKIAFEHLTAWYYVNCLLARDWNPFFKAYETKIRQITAKMHGYREYAEVKYRDLKPEIEKEVASGVSYTECPVCSQPAFCTKEENRFFFSGECRVCETHNRYLRLEKCPHCGKGPVVIENGYDRCSQCYKEITPNDIVELLEEEIDPASADEFGKSEINCGSCDGYETVSILDGELICLNCFEIFARDEVHTCEYCGDEYAGSEIEDSYITGCGQCDGALEH